MLSLLNIAHIDQTFIKDYKKKFKHLNGCVSDLDMNYTFIKGIPF